MSEPPPYSKLEQLSSSSSPSTSSKPPVKPLTPITIESLTLEIERVKSSNQTYIKELEIAHSTADQLHHIVQLASSHQICTPAPTTTSSNLIAPQVGTEKSTVKEIRKARTYIQFSLEEANKFLGLKEDCSETDEEVSDNFDAASIEETSMEFRKKIRGAMLTVALSRRSSPLLKPYISAIYKQEASAHVKFIGMIDEKNNLPEEYTSPSGFPNFLRSLGIGGIHSTIKKISSHDSEMKSPMKFDVIELEDAMRLIGLSHENVTTRELGEIIPDLLSKAFDDETTASKFHGAIITACLNRSKPHLYRPWIERIIIAEVQAYFESLTLPSNLVARDFVDGIIRCSRAIMIAEVESFRKACEILKVNEHASTREILGAFDKLDPGDSYQACGAILRICDTKEHLPLLTPSLRIILLQELQTYLQVLELPESVRVSQVRLLSEELGNLRLKEPFEVRRLKLKLKGMEDEYLSLVDVFKRKEIRETEERDRKIEVERVKNFELDKCTIKLEELESVEKGLKDEIERLKKLEKDEVEEEKERVRLALPKKMITKSIQVDLLPPPPPEPIPTPINLIPLLGELSEELSAFYTESFTTMLEIRDLLGFPEINYPIRMEEGGGRRRSN